MNNSYIGKSAEEILALEITLDSAGHLFRALAWIDFYRRKRTFSPLLYACIEGRMAIEYLFFEILVVGAGAQLSKEDYEKCLKERSKLDKMISRLIPEYECMQRFTGVLIEFEPSLPRALSWNIAELKKQWGMLSEFVHWNGARNLTTETPHWNELASKQTEDILNSIRSKMESGAVMSMPPQNMKSEIRDVYDDYRLGKIDLASVRIRLSLLKAVLSAKYR